MRVAIVSPGYPPDRGGVEAHVAALAHGLVDVGHEVEVFCASRQCVAPTIDRCEVVVHTFPAWALSSMSVSPRLLWRALRLGRHFDVVHVQSYHASSGAACLVGLRSMVGPGTKVVFTPHYHGVGHTRFANVAHTVYPAFGAVLFHCSRAVICVSHAEKTLLNNDFPRCADRVTVIPNGADVHGIRSARPYPDEPPTVLSLGRLEGYKHTERAIAAMVGLAGPSQLVVIGEGSERAALTAQAHVAGLDGQVRFLGQVDDATVHRWLRTARVVVSLSEHEAYGMVPVEAVCAGARVVLSDIPAHRELVEARLGEAARIVGRGCDVGPALAEFLALDEPVDVDVPDWREVAAATVSVYRNVCKQ